jgi:RNA polymerase sigma factor (sigma-70 family)
MSEGDAQVGPQAGPLGRAPSRPVAPDAAAWAALVERIAAQGDKQAFAELFRHFAPRVKSYLIRLGAAAPQAEELAQEAMIMVWRKAASFDRGQSSVATWLFTIARNKRIDAIRRERRPEIDPSDPLLVPDPEPAPDAAIDANQRDARLRAAIATLPAEQADLLRLAFYEDKSHGDIAQERGLPLGTVKSRLRLAFGRLRKAMDGVE